MTEYQEAIIKIVKQLNNPQYIKMLFGFAKELQKREDEEK